MPDSRSRETSGPDRDRDHARRLERPRDMASEGRRRGYDNDRDRDRDRDWDARKRERSPVLSQQRYARSRSPRPADQGQLVNLSFPLACNPCNLKSLANQSAEELLPM